MQLIGLFVLYFFVNFVVCARQDWQRRRFVRIPAELELEEFRIALLARSDQRIQDAVERFEEIQAIIKRREELWAELDNLPESERPKRLREINDIIENDGLEKLVDTQGDSAGDTTTLDRGMRLFDLKKTVKISDRLRFFLEILFPILLGLAALASVSYRLLH